MSTKTRRLLVGTTVIGVSLLGLAPSATGSGDAQAGVVSSAAARGEEVPPPTTVPGLASQLIGTLGPTLGETIGIDGFVDPDVACLDGAIAAFDPAVGEAVVGLTQDPSMFHALADADAAIIATAYLDCVGAEALPGAIAAFTTRAIEQLPCIAEGWAGLVSPQVIASSLAYGNGLDDLPTDVVDQMTLAAAVCVPDRQWWIDDEAFLLVQRGLDAPLATCLATAVVDTFGVGPIIERRVLTLPLYPVARADLERVVAGCDVTLPENPQLNAPPGTCLTGFGGGALATDTIGCDQPHNAEVVTVTDLTAEFPAWPGAQVLYDTVADRCAADVGALPGDLTQYGAGWDIAGRMAWEQDDRVLTCVLIRPDFGSWTGPSGLVPPIQPPPSTSTS